MAAVKNVLDETPDPEWVKSEIALLEAEVDKFAEAMKARLREKAQAGWKRWNDPALADQMYTDMLAHAAGIKRAAGQEADIANLAMFLWRINNGFVGV